MTWTADYTDDDDSGYGSVGWIGSDKGSLPACLTREEMWDCIRPFRRGGSPELGDRLDAAVFSAGDGDDRMTALSDLPSMFWSPWLSAGFHECEPCLADGLSAVVESGRRAERIGNGEVALKTLDGEHLFWMPPMIGHYVRAHGYLPPAEFLAAFEHYFPPSALEG